MAVSGIGRILGRALGYLLVPGATGLLLDFGFWRFTPDMSLPIEVGFGGVCGGIGAALSRLPLVRKASESEGRLRRARASRGVQSVARACPGPPGDRRRGGRGCREAA